MTHARRFSIAQQSKVLLLLGVMLGLLLAVPAVASAAAGWQSGPLVESQDFNCITGDVEQEAGTYMSYYTDPSNPPKAGDVYYVAIDVTGIGNTCAGIYADVNLGLPSGTSLAVSSTNPVLCYLKFPNSNSFSRDTADCPQNLGAGTTPGFYSLDPVHANPPFYPLPQGGTAEIQVPVTSAAGVNKFEGYVQLADGDYDPSLAPTLTTIVDPATVTSTGTTNNPVGVYYATPSISGQAQQPNQTVTVTYTAWVQNNGNDGSVTPQLGTAVAVVDPHTNKTTLSCSSPTPFSLSFGSATLHSPNTVLNGTFTSLVPGGAYCWRLVATVTTGVAAGTYYGNWQYFATTGSYIQNFESAPYQPPSSQPLNVAQCSSDGAGCATSGCGSGASCTGGGSLGGLSHTLDLSFAGTGTGSVAGPVSFACSKTCSGTFSPGATIKLTAAPGSQSKFVGWSGGGCSGTGTCTVTMTADQSVTADFASTAVVVVVKPACSLSVSSSKLLVHKRHGSKAPLDALVLTAKCSQTVTGRLTGMLTEHLSKKRSKHIKLPSASVTVRAGAATTFHLKVPSAAIRGLKRHVKESVALTLTASNANGGAVATASVGRIRATG